MKNLKSKIAIAMAIAMTVSNGTLQGIALAEETVVITEETAGEDSLSCAGEEGIPEDPDDSAVEEIEIQEEDNIVADDDVVVSEEEVIIDSAEDETETAQTETNVQEAQTSEKKTTEDGFQYQVVNGSLTITGYTGTETEITIPTTINGEQVTSIGMWAFQDSNTLTSVTIPYGVTEIGWAAFGSCSCLTTVVLPESVTSIGQEAFADCSRLTEITLPNSLISIGAKAFSNCTALASITIPESVTDIQTVTGDGTRVSPFDGCSSLNTISVSCGLSDDISSYLNYGISASVEKRHTYGDWETVSAATVSQAEQQKRTCSRCGETETRSYDLNVQNTEKMTNSDGFQYRMLNGVLTIVGYTGTETEITIPTTIGGVQITSINYFAFSGNSALTSVTIPYGVTEIGWGAFSQCSNLTKIVIPESVTTIGDNAFSDCSSLKEIDLPDSLLKIGVQAFSGCTALTSITIPDNVTDIQTVTGDGTRVSPFDGCSSLNTISVSCGLSNDISSYLNYGISASVEKYHAYSNWETVSSATTSQAEQQQRTCSRCGATETRSYGNKLGTIKVSASSLTLTVGQSTTSLKASGFASGDYLASVVSSDASVLTVSDVKKTGTMKLTAKKAGTATLTLTTAWNGVKKVTVTVKASTKTTSISGVAKKLSIQNGKTATLKPVISPSTSTEKVTYKSSNTKVATVSSTGVIKGVKPGTAKITVTSGSKKVTCTVTVTKVKNTKLTGISKKVTLKKSKTLTLKPQRYPSNSTSKITYKSSNKKVATVTSSGKIKAKKKGKAVITIKCGSATVKCTVVVK